jgi:hypothetical protein
MLERVFGIDFSGAANAGDAIWLAQARIEDNRIKIETCRPAAGLARSGAARVRCLPALVEFVAAQREIIVGCDFPFSLPARMIEAPTWSDFALGLADRFPLAEDFLADCRRRGNGRELKRACDSSSRVPFAAYNIRIYRQTYYGIRDFLAPLVRERRAVVLPMQQRDGGRPCIIETCPASTLKAAGLYRSYKGAARDMRVARRRLINDLIGHGLLMPLSRMLQRVAIGNARGDALDSMIAAAATARAYLAGELEQPPQQAIERMEGHVFY